MINPTTLNSPIARASTLSTNTLSKARTLAPTAPVATQTAIAKPLAAPLSPVNDAFAKPAVSPLKLNDPGLQSLLAPLSPAALNSSAQTLASALNEPAAKLSLDSPESAFAPAPSFESPQTSVAQDLQAVKDLLRQALAISDLGDELGLPDWANKGSGGGVREILPPPGTSDGGW